MEISSRVLKITGSIEITEGVAEMLQYQKDYPLTITASLVKTHENDLQDNTIRKTYTLKIADAEFSEL